MSNQSEQLRYLIHGLLEQQQVERFDLYHLLSTQFSERLTNLKSHLYAIKKIVSSSEATKSIIDLSHQVEAALDSLISLESQFHKLSQTFNQSEPQNRVQDTPLLTLTTRETEVLQLLTSGKTNTHIGQLLHISPRTVETYRSRIMKKLAMDNLPDLVKFALKHELISLE